MVKFMTKMTELLETTLASQKGERTSATGIDKALERFMRFRPRNSTRKKNKKLKAEQYLEHLTDIYDTLGYDDARK